LDDPVVSFIKTGQLNSTTTRVVLDLNSEINYQVEKNEDSLLISVNYPTAEPGEATDPTEPGGQAGFLI